MNWHLKFQPKRGNMKVYLENFAYERCALGVLLNQVVQRKVHTPLQEAEHDGLHYMQVVFFTCLRDVVVQTGHNSLKTQTVPKILKSKRNTFFTGYFYAQYHQHYMHSGLSQLANIKPSQLNIQIILKLINQLLYLDIHFCH